MLEAVRRVVDPFLANVDAVLGTTYTALLFGSAARGDYVAGHSDINLMLIVERADPAELARLAPAFAAWRRTMPVLPLVLTRDEWLHGSDVFPIEICDLRAAHQVLRGPDLVSQVRADPGDLRRALEKEFRGKVLRLRQRYLAQGERKLGEWAGTTIPAIVVFLRCLLSLVGRPVPADPRTVIENAGALVGFDPAPVLRVLACRGYPAARLTGPDFEGYLAAVERTARFTDELDLGDQHS
ncbi:MAG TPA: nucleotidyltransferase domain-containing protein [Gemmatimonadales bacterium]|nr:nucleotidyltransferase domain-containing protein [Gemmatimonadales bacterium]